MKYTPGIILLLLAGLGPSTSSAAAYQISWSADRDLRERPRDGAVELRISDGLQIEGEKWPARVVRFEIPADARVRGLRLTPQREHTLALPAGTYIGAGLPAAWQEPATEASGYRYWVLPEGDFRGHRIGHLLIVPFRQTDGELRFLEAFDFEVETEGGVPAAQARRIVHPRTEAADLRTLRAMLDTEPLPPRPPDNDAAMPPLPPEMGPETTEYVVITSDAMASVFQELATLKTKEGHPATVTTVEWILANYDGVDLAARIRAYLRDLYLYQGLLYALLAGDADQVPARLATARFLEPDGVEVISDFYFACIDGDWNADADDEFGEAEGDEADRYYDIAVSRAPCGSVEEAQTFIAKWKSYTGYDPGNFRTDYQRKFLALGEVLFPDDWEPGDPPGQIVLDGADICEEAMTHIPPFFTRKRLYQYFDDPSRPPAEPELRDSVIANINRGYGWVDHVGHGFRTNMSVGDGKLFNGDADDFSNTNAYGILYAANCTSGAFLYDCIVEHWLMNPTGGVVASIASTDLDYPSVSDAYQYELLDQIFDYDAARLADAFHQANLVFAPLASEENAHRWTIFTLIAMGEPTMEIWRDTPANLSLTHSLTMPLGAGSFSVTVAHGGNPVEGATVCLWKSDGYGVAVTDASGQAQVPFLPETLGNFTITATKNGYVPKTSTAQAVAATTAALRVDAWTTHDGTAGGGSGNADNRPDAGESIVVDLTLRNRGTGTATGVSATLHANSPFVTVADSTVASGNIAAGGTAALAGAFAFSVSPNLPDSLRHVVVPATLGLVCDQGTWTEPFPFNLYQRQLDVVGLDWSIVTGDADGQWESGETAEIYLTLTNRGEGFAGDVVGVGTPAASGFVMIDDTIDFGDVASGTSVEGDALSVLSTGGNAMSFAVDVTVSDAYSGGLLDRGIDVINPATPDSIRSVSTDRSIHLSWLRPNSLDVRGYRVYRSSDEGGPFDPLTSEVVEGGSVYTDENLAPLTSYFYKVSTVDWSGNESALSAAVQAGTSPPLLEGWPLDLGAGTSASSPTFANLDGGLDSEIILGWRYPMVVRSDGGDFVDGDDDALTIGIFSTIENGESMFWNSPAVGNFDEDELDELVFCAWQTTGQGHIYLLDESGAVEPGWPQEIGQQPWSTAAAGDVDGDGDSEIFVSSGAGSGAYRGVLFGFHHDGTEILDGDSNPATHGVFHKSADAGAGYMYSSPALADISDDNVDDIIFVERTRHSAPSKSTLFVFRGNHTNLPGFPYAPANLRASTASPAVADFNQDGRRDVVFVTENEIHVVEFDGTPLTGWPKSLPAIPDIVAIKDFLSSPAIGDIDGDGELDIVLGWLGGKVYAWTGDGGALHANFPVDIADNGSDYEDYVRSPALGNIDGDPLPEIIVGVGDAKLFAIKSNGTTMTGFPIQLEDVIPGSVAVWDVTGHGNVNMIVQTGAPLLRVFDFFDVPFVGSEHPWPMFRRDARKSGLFRPHFTTGVDDEAGSPRVAAASPPRPNPFGPRVTLPFAVPAGGDRVRIRIFDVGGRDVRTLADGRFPAGQFRIVWDGRTSNGLRLAPGVYFARIEIGSSVFSQKLAMLQ
jgi:hypothetical protein